MIYEQNEPQNILFESIAEDNTKWVWCTNIHIAYCVSLLPSLVVYHHLIKVILIGIIICISQILQWSLVRL